MLYERKRSQYHRHPRPGRSRWCLSNPCLTQADLSLAYTPGVAIPCPKIQRRPGSVYRVYLPRQLIAVITNGTAVLGLATSAPWPANRSWRARAFFSSASPTDVFDIEVNAAEPYEFIRTVKALEPISAA